VHRLPVTKAKLIEEGNKAVNKWGKGLKMKAIPGCPSSAFDYPLSQFFN